jgi:transcriptional regulator with XRE-family HTH domain
MDVRTQFGRVLREKRNAKGFTQEELAFRAGMSGPYLSDLERGRNNPSLSMLVDLAQALDVHPAALIAPLRIDGADSLAPRKRPKD